MKKKVLSITLALTLTAALLAPVMVSAAETRAEALRTIIQTIGRESEALSETAENPFTDVPNWADRYAAYAYKNGIIAGVGDNRFEPDRTVTADEYSIMLSRAKGLANTNSNQSITQNSLVIAKERAHGMK